MVGQDVRRYIDAGLAPLAGRITVSPHAITLSSLAVMAGAAGLVLAGRLVAAGLLILLSGGLDLLDGAVARARSLATPFGALLDRVVDRAADFVLLAAIILGNHVEPWLGLYVMLTVLLASYISACIEAATASQCGRAMSLRAVRVIILALACFTDNLPAGMALLALIGTYASGARLYAAYRTLR